MGGPEFAVNESMLAWAVQAGPERLGPWELVTGDSGISRVSDRRVGEALGGAKARYAKTVARPQSAETGDRDRRAGEVLSRWGWGERARTGVVTSHFDGAPCSRGSFTVNRPEPVSERFAAWQRSLGNSLRRLIRYPARVRAGWGRPVMGNLHGFSWSLFSV